MSICQRSLEENWRVEKLKDWRLQFFHSSRWRITDSNRWPPACKAGALASWANPPWVRNVVPGRLELPTSTLSVWRSNQLSYRTGFKLSAISLRPASSILYSKKQKAWVQEAWGFLSNHQCSLPFSLFRYIVITIFRNIEHPLQKGGVPCFTWLAPSCNRNPFQDSPERRCSSRTFRYGYLVTT